MATPGLAERLLGPATNPRHENWLDPGVKPGAKSTIGAGCIIAAGCTVGDKNTLKRSVVGRNAHLGRDVKVGRRPPLPAPALTLFSSVGRAVSQGVELSAAVSQLLPFVVFCSAAVGGMQQSRFLIAAASANMQFRSCGDRGGGWGSQPRAPVFVTDAPLSALIQLHSA